MLQRTCVELVMKLIILKFDHFFDFLFYLFFLTGWEISWNFYSSFGFSCCINLLDLIFLTVTSINAPSKVSAISIFQNIHATHILIFFRIFQPNFYFGSVYSWLCYHDLPYKYFKIWVRYLRDSLNFSSLLYEPSLFLFIRKKIISWTQ